LGYKDTIFSISKLINFGKK